MPQMSQKEFEAQSRVAGQEAAAGLERMEEEHVNDAVCEALDEQAEEHAKELEINDALWEKVFDEQDERHARERAASPTMEKLVKQQRLDANLAATNVELGKERVQLAATQEERKAWSADLKMGVVPKRFRGTGLKSRSAGVGEDRATKTVSDTAKAKDASARLKKGQTNFSWFHDRCGVAYGAKTGGKPGQSMLPGIKKLVKDEKRRNAELVELVLRLRPELTRAKLVTHGLVGDPLRGESSDEEEEEGEGEQ